MPSISSADHKRLWVSRNRSILTKVAKATGTKPQFVSMVLYGSRRSTGGRVERKLREAGAPL
jgi:hypothetical protein